MINMTESGRLMDGVIFDVDGTLLDTMPYWHDAGARFLATLGIEAEEGLGDKLFPMAIGEAAEYVVREYDLGMSVEEAVRGIDAGMEKAYYEEAGFKEGAKELLLRIREQSIPITVATSTDRYMIEAAFERLGIADLFEGIFTCTEIGQSKSSPAIFFAAIDLMKTRAEKTWVFEDGLYAVKTARAEGFRTVGVYDRVSESDQEELAGTADFYYKSLREFDII